MMTEDQAREKWCPHSGTKDEKTGSCIASRCSQWRWVPPRMQMDCAEEKPSYAPAFGPWEKHPNGWISQEAPNEGYCGLAGQP